MFAHIIGSDLVLDFTNERLLVDIFAWAIVRSLWILLVEPDDLRINAQAATETGCGRYCVLADSKAASRIKFVGIVVTKHFNAERNTVPAWRVPSCRIQRREYPYLMVIDKQMRPRSPAHRLIVRLQIQDMLFCEPVWPLSKIGGRGIMNRNETRPPIWPTDPLAV